MGAALRVAGAPLRVGSGKRTDWLNQLRAPRNTAVMAEPMPNATSAATAPMP